MAEFYSFDASGSSSFGAVDIGTLDAISSAATAMSVGVGAAAMAASALYLAPSVSGSGFPSYTVTITASTYASGSWSSSGRMTTPGSGYYGQY